jgi:hypothetical protein
MGLKVEVPLMLLYPFLRTKLVWSTLVKIMIICNAHTTKVTSKEIFIMHKAEIMTV